MHHGIPQGHTFSDVVHGISRSVSIAPASTLALNTGGMSTAAAHKIGVPLEGLCAALRLLLACSALLALCILLSLKSAKRIPASCFLMFAAVCLQGSRELQRLFFSFLAFPLLFFSVLFLSFLILVFLVMTAVGPQGSNGLHLEAPTLRLQVASARSHYLR